MVSALRSAVDHVNFQPKQCASAFVAEQQNYVSGIKYGLTTGVFKGILLFALQNAGSSVGPAPAKRAV
jgi:hypothetical protein